MEIKEILKKYIDIEGANINFIAKATKMTRQAIYKIKNGSVNPKVDSIKKICDCFNNHYGAKLNYKDFF